jgi:hypothetical protein
MSLIIDGIAASEHLDSSGEVLKISGHDISDLTEGRGVVNWDHSNQVEDIIGAITFAKKIMKRAECDNSRERMYWDACGTPFVYIKAELFDGEDHPGAVAAAAMIRYYHKKKEKILAGFSIEGSTLDRKDNILERTVGRRVALTLRPCNKSAISGLLSDGSTTDDVKKYMDMGADSQTRVVEIDSMILDDVEKKESSALKDLKLAILELRKTLTAGSYDVAPGSLTQGSALQTESVTSRSRGLSDDSKKKIKSVVLKWDKKVPLRAAIKAALPEVSDDYVDHFTKLAEEMSLKKSQRNVKIEPHYSDNLATNDKQRHMMTGINVDAKSDDNSMFGINHVGDPVMIKKAKLDHDGEAKSATAYYHLADSFFGMGDHVPVTNHFTHPELDKTGKTLQVQQFLHGADLPFSSKFDKDLINARADGSLHKLHLMDMITGGDLDRHIGNVISNGGKIVHIDNDDAFNYDRRSPEPDTFGNYHTLEDFDVGKDLPHIEAVKWLKALSPSLYANMAVHSGLSKDKAAEGAKRIKLLQNEANGGKTLKEMHRKVNGRG